MKKGIFIGRFQPFHLGHLNVIEEALKKVDFLFIAIGSSQESHTAENPFHADERVTMIQDALTQAGIEPSKYAIIPVPDINNNPQWPAHVRDHAQDFDILFTRSKIVRDLFEKFDDAKIVWVDEKIKVNATKIREKIREGKEWKTDLPPAVATYFESIDGIDRIKFPRDSKGNPSTQ